MMDRAAYLREVVTAYQGEVRGEATFTTSAQLATDAGEIEIWRTLARLEATTRRRMLPLMERYGLDTTPDEAERRVGRERAEARAAAGFRATLDAMAERLPPFVALYTRLEAEGPSEDREELAFLNAHEVALHEFVTRALAGDGREALRPVRKLLGD